MVPAASTSASVALSATWASNDDVFSAQVAILDLVAPDGTGLLLRSFKSCLNTEVKGWEQSATATF